MRPCTPTLIPRVNLKWTINLACIPLDCGRKLERTQACMRTQKVSNEGTQLRLEPGSWKLRSFCGCCKISHITHEPGIEIEVCFAFMYQICGIFNKDMMWSKSLKKEKSLFLTRKSKTVAREHAAVWRVFSQREQGQGVLYMTHYQHTGV